MNPKHLEVAAGSLTLRRDAIHLIDAAAGKKTAPSRIPHPPFPIWRVPSRRNDLFTGREETLTQLSTLLAVGQRLVQTQIAALCGPSGIGKTEIALEYAYRFRHHYLSVFWLHADTQHALVSAFVSLAAYLDLSEQYVQDKMQAVSAVKNWLARTSKWLLILDDVSRDFMKR